MADVDIEILNAVNGEQLAVFTMSPSETLQDLYLRMRSSVSTERMARMPRLLLEGKELVSSVTSLRDAGIDGPGPVAVMLIWRVEPATLTCLATVNISDEGYHCHDTHLVQVPSPDAGTFYMSWRRSYDKEWGSYRAHIEAIRSRKERRLELEQGRVNEHVVVDALKDGVVGEAAKTKQLSLWQIPERIPAELVVENKILAIFNGKVLVSTLKNERDTCFHEPADFPQVQVLELDAGHQRVVWHRWNAIELVHFEEGGGRGPLGGPLELQELWVVKDKFVALAKNWEAWHLPSYHDGNLPQEKLLQGTFDEAGLLSFTQWEDVQRDDLCSKHLPHEEKIYFVGSDASGRYMLFHIDEGELLCLSLETLQTSTVLCPRLEIFEETKRDRQIHCVMDPVTEDLYFFVDSALKSFRTDFQTPSCIVFRLRAEKAEETGRPPDFQKSRYDLICWHHLGIDGFSDSFCISLLSYSTEHDAILIFDATNRLWSLPMKQARFQDALETGWEDVDLYGFYDPNEANAGLAEAELAHIAEMPRD